MHGRRRNPSHGGHTEGTWTRVGCRATFVHSIETSSSPLLGCSSCDCLVCSCARRVCVCREQLQLLVDVEVFVASFHIAAQHARHAETLTRLKLYCAGPMMLWNRANQYGSNHAPGNSMARACVSEEQKARGPHVVPTTPRPRPQRSVPGSPSSKPFPPSRSWGFPFQRYCATH